MIYELLSGEYFRKYGTSSHQNIILCQILMQSNSPSEKYSVSSEELQNSRFSSISLNAEHRYVLITVGDTSDLGRIIFGAGYISIRPTFNLS